MLVLVNCHKVPQQEALLSPKQTLLTWKRSVHKDAFPVIKMEFSHVKVTTVPPGSHLRGMRTRIVQEAGHVHPFSTAPAS